MQTFSLTQRQSDLRDIAASPARHILAFGGSRSGKTFGFCYCVAVRALSAPDSRHLISRLHNIDVRQSVLMDTWPKMMRLAFPAVAVKSNLSDQFLTLPNGAEIWFGGLDDKERIEKILGKEYATIYVNEASQVPYETILTLRTRLAQNAKKADGRQLDLKAYYDLNPTGRAHWTYREFVEGKRPDNDLPLPEGVRAHLILNPTDNPFLAQAYLDELAALPERQRQRFLEGKYLSEVPGALWPIDAVESLRVGVVPDLKRIVVAVDPSGSDGVGGDSQGIVVCGVGNDDHGYVLADRSCRKSPTEWAEQAVQAYRDFSADQIVVEANYGGEMVRTIIRTADPLVPVKVLHASRAKHLRAEPIADLYGRGLVHHVGRFAALEDQMGMMTTAGFQGSGSPDRLDAMVWALTDLLVPATAPRNPKVW